MTRVPSWLEEHLQCPQTGVPLVEEIHEGRAVYVARPGGGDPLYYDIDNGVPVLLPQG